MSRRRTNLYKAPWPFVLNLGSPLAQGLVFYGVPVGGKIINLAGKPNSLTLTGPVLTPMSLDGGLALLFDGVNDYAEGSPPITATPLSMACWFRAVNVTETDALISLNVFEGDSTSRWQLTTAGTTGGDPVQVVSGSTALASTSTGYVAGKWHHACGVFASSTDRRVFLDGGGKGTNATSNAPSGIDILNIGVRYFSGALAGFFTGRMSDVLIWNRALSDAEALELYDSRTRWQLRYQPGRKVWSFAALTGIQFDAASNSGYQAASASYSWSHAWAGANRGLSVDVSILSVPGTTVTSITYNGQPLSLVIGQSTITTSLGRVESWAATAQQLGGLAAGNYTIAVTLSASVASASTAASYTGVHQTSPTEEAAGAQATNAGVGNNASVSVTTIADNDWVHAAIVTDDGSVTAGQTSRNNVTGAVGSGANEDTGPKTPAGAQAMTYSGLGIVATWAMTAYAWRPIAAATTTPIGKGYFIQQAVTNASTY